MPLPSKEYREFLEEGRKVKILSFYEKMCNFSETILPISPWKGLQEKYKEAINFSHLKITPRGAFSLAILIAMIVFLVPIILGFVFNFLSLGVISLTLVFTGLAFYYAYDYPTYFSILFRIKASAEMVLCVVYMTIAMRITPNIENAVRFAADNLTGPLAIDLRQLMWDVYVRKYDTVSSALDSFIDKWKMENEEFTEAVYLVKTSVAESMKRRESTMDEAVSVVLNGSKERMKHYAQELQTPISILNAMGILLPIIGLVFFPIIGIFLSDVIQPVFIAVGYNILLPFCVYWMMKTSLGKRPYSFHQPDISRHPKFLKEKILGLPLLLSILIPLPAVAYGLYKFNLAKEIFSFDLLLSSLVVFSGLVGGVAFYFIFTTYRKLKLREELVSIEREFTEALFYLGKQLQRGIPIEKALEKMTVDLKDLKISTLFRSVLHNIKIFGMTFEQAVFDEKTGAIRLYPSKTISAIMRAIVEISKRGMGVMSSAMISISNYLKGVHVVEEELRDSLSEVTSTMQIQALLLAPLTSGIVVALAAMIMQMMVSFKEVVESMHADLLAAGPVGFAGGGILGSILNIDKMIPVQYFQMIVGIYLIEVVTMLAIFLSKIKYGEENLMRGFNVGKMVLLASGIYVLVVILLFSTFTSLMPIMGLVA